MATIESLIAAQEAEVTEANAIGAAGGTASESVSLHRVQSGDNGNGGTYTADVVIQATVTVTQPTEKPQGAGSTNSSASKEG